MNRLAADHFFEPRNVGDADEPAFSGRAASLVCGAHVRFSIQIDEAQRVSQARFRAAGCDVLPVCNRRASVIALLDGLKSQPGPASQLRVLRMRGKEAPARAALLASRQYTESRECLARCERPPELTLT